MAAGVVSAIALGAHGPASRLAGWTQPGGERLAGASAAGTVAGAQQTLDTAVPGELSVLGALPPPFGGAGTPTPLPRPTYAPLPIRILPPPPVPQRPSRPTPAPGPSATPAPAPTQPPAVLGPGSATRAPQPAPTSTAAPTPPPHRPAPRTPAPAPAPTRAPAPAPAPPPPPVVALTGPAAITYDTLNASRAANGLGALRADPALTRAAQAHADQIAAAGNLTHTGYIDDVNAQGVSWQGLGEVLGAYALTPNAAVIEQLWMQSAEHRPIILDGQYTAVGIGWAQSSNGWWYVSAILMY